MVLSETGSRCALVTGASEGIGRELAEVMAGDGWNLIILARRENLLNELATEITSRHSVDVKILPSDLSRSEAPREIYEKTLEWGIAVDALVNNAGFGITKAFQDSDYQRVVDMLQVNITSLTQLTHLFLPDMVRRGRGWILNVSSLAAYLPMPNFAAYAASKAYVLNFSEALTREVEGSGVKVSCLCPGPTATGFGRVAGQRQPSRREIASTSAEVVAGLGYKGMISGKRIIIPGWMNRLMPFVLRFAPRSLVLDVASRIMEKRMAR